MHGKFFCPFVKCGNGRWQSVNDIRTHVICEGIILNYTKWIWHGELPDMPTVSDAEPVNVDMRHGIEDMIHNLGQHNFQQVHAPLYDKIQKWFKQAFCIWWIWRHDLGGVTRASLNCLCYLKRCFLKITHCWRITMRRRRFYVQLEWSTKKNVCMP